MLERGHLTILRAVEQQGSLTKAAEFLCLTQSALSHTMRKLEREMGTELWLRQGRSMRLTQAGEYLLAAANRLLPQFELAEARLRQFAQGERGTLRIGMECHPCYQWLLKIVSPYLKSWPEVDVDVKQRFQFGGIGALFGHEIDLLVTPDPLYKTGLHYEPVFDYEQVLVVNSEHALAGQAWLRPEQLSNEVLITYPVTIDRLDVYSQFLQPAGISPRKQKAIETTDIMMQMVATAAAVSRRCRAGWPRSTRRRCPWWRCVWASTASPSRSTWAFARPSWVSTMSPRSSSWPRGAWAGDGRLAHGNKLRSQTCKFNL